MYSSFNQPSFFRGDVNSEAILKRVLNTRIPKPIQDVPTAAPVHAPWRASAVLWKLQAYGLLGITFLSFFPRLFHSQEYAFFNAMEFYSEIDALAIPSEIEGLPLVQLEAMASRAHPAHHIPWPNRVFIRTGRYSSASRACSHANPTAYGT